MSTKKLRELDRQAKQYNIVFDGPGSKKRWPDVHARHFTAIQAQGSQTYGSYRDASRANFNDQPWRSKTRQRAEQISAEARQLYHDKSNEMEWRLSLEPDILARFKHRVNCTRCQLRVWRSDVEVIVDPERAQKIEGRRQKRSQALCKCSEYDRMQQDEEEDRDQIFSDRMERLIIPEENLQAVLADQKPDHLYGLRPTSLLAEVLRDLYYANKEKSWSESSKEMISSTSPLGEKGEHILFPFLILEAKAQEGPSFQLIETQTAFPIRALLQLQSELCSHSTVLLPFPLVWFLANRGSEWRVYACFIETNDGITGLIGQSNKQYVSDRQSASTIVPMRTDQRKRVVKLWAGDICEIDHALQLLLMIDYIFDWARDEYRSDIFRRLCQIARPEIPDNVTISGESKLYSWYPGSMMPEIPDGENITEDSDHVEAPNISPYHEFDSKTGCLRSANYIESRVKGLFISRDNVDTLLQSVTDKEKFARSVLHTLRNNMVFNMKLTANDLSNIHEIWTGDAGNSIIAGQFETFHTKLNFRSFFTETWDLVRQLSYLAVSDDAIKVLFASSGRTRRVNLKSVFPITDSLAIELHRLRTGCAEFNVHAAMVRLSLAFVMEPREVTYSRKGKKRFSSCRPALANSCEYDEYCGRSDESYAVIEKIYCIHTLGGKRLLEEPYLRHSCREEQRSNDDANAISHPIALSETLRIYKESQGNREFVPMIGDRNYTSTGDARPELCLYQIKGEENITIPQLTSLVYELVERKAEIHETSRCLPKRIQVGEEWNPHTYKIQNLATLSSEREYIFCEWISDLFDLLPEALKDNTMSLYECYVKAMNDFTKSEICETEWEDKKCVPFIPTRDTVLASLALASQERFLVPIDSAIVESWIISGCFRYRGHKALNDRSDRISKHLHIHSSELRRWFKRVWRLKTDVPHSATTGAELPVPIPYPNSELVNKIVAERAASSSNHEQMLFPKRPRDYPAPERTQSTERTKKRRR